MLILGLFIGFKVELAEKWERKKLSRRGVQMVKMLND